MNVVFTPTAWQQYTEWQTEDKRIVKRINELQSKSYHLFMQISLRRLAP